jgi:hypothetical protein
MGEDKRPPLYYLGTPYGHDLAEVREARYRENVEALTELLHQGINVFSPVVHHHPVACLRDLGRDFSFWQTQDFAFLHRSDALIVLTLPGWQESKGLAAEVEEARRLGLPVFFWDRANKAIFREAKEDADDDHAF